MLACLLGSHGKVLLEDVPVPRLRRGDVLVRMRASGVCGTDLEKIRGDLGPGGILGHEVSGIIEEVADGVKGLEPGMRVIAHHHVPCYNCYYCQHGDHTMCDSFKTTNIDPCGFAECFRVPEANVSNGALIPLPENMGFEEAALLEPAACCIRALDAARAAPRDNVLIVGLGPTGLTQLQLLRYLGAATILGTDIQKARLEVAKRLGADQVLNPGKEDVPKEVLKATRIGVDLAIVATGNPKALSQAFSSVRKGGRVLLFGAPGRGSTFNLDTGSLFTRQVSLITSYSCVEAEISRAMKLVAQKAIDLSSLITHRFPLSECEKAFQVASSPVAVKTMIIN